MSFKKTTPKKDISGCFFGLPEFDAINHNSLKKGSIVTIEEDSPTKTYIGFLRYFIGCGFHLAEKILVFHESYYQFSDMIPKKQSQPKNSTSNKEQTENKIAWRYENFKDASLGLNINANIPILDLSRSEKLTSEQSELIKEFDISQFSTLKQFYEELTLQYQHSLSDHEDCSTKRIVIKNLSGCEFYEKAPNSQKIQFFHSLKYFAKASHVLITISLPSDITNFERKAILNVSDIYIKLSSTLDKEAFSAYEGIMHIFKCLKPASGLATIKPDADSWCIKSTKKSISLIKLHLDPENEEEKSNDKSSLLCMPNKTKKNPFEF